MEDKELKTRLEEERTRLVKIIESLEALDKSEEWNTLKELVFDKSLEAIERQILNESLGQVIDTSKLYRLQGERAWSKQFSDVNQFVEMLKKQLEEIKKRLK